MAYSWAIQRASVEQDVLMWKSGKSNMLLTVSKENGIMRVKIGFDVEKIKEIQLVPADVFYTVEKAFADRGMLCEHTEDGFVFTDRGREDDFSDMWIVLMKLIRTKWFVKCATSCVFFDDEDDEGEDVLAQAWKVRR